VRISLQTDDGALVYLTYDGDIDPERGNDHARSIDAQMKFLPGALSIASVTAG